MMRVIFLSAPLLLASLSISLPAPAYAQARSRTGEDCQQQRQTSRRRGRGIGGFLGNIPGGLGGRVGGVANVVTNVLPVGQLLGEAIAGLLDCDEQRRAATATEEAVRGGVGTTASWESETRPGVTGSSTVTAADDGQTVEGDCMTVTDIVIIDGEETRAPKRMCRRPPTNRYVRV
jgi:surface antigen